MFGGPHNKALKEKPDMNTPTKATTKSTGSGNDTQVLRETTEKGKEAFENVSAATADAGKLLRDTYSTAVTSA